MRCLRFSGLLIAVPLLTLFSGCNYIHFGRLNRIPGDAALARDNSDLKLEKKILQQELAIARKESEVLRSALDRQPTAAAAGAEELAARLNETTRELATLRASYTRLQAERERLQSDSSTRGSTSANFAAAEQIADLKNRLGTTEDKLADTLRTFTALQEENQQLRTSLDETRAENVSLTRKFEQVTAQNNEARSALAQLNTEFLAQKEARAQAEQNVGALRAQLHAITNQGGAGAAPTLASARESSAAGAREIDSTLHVAQLPGDAPASALLSVNPAKLRAAGSEPTPPPAPKAVRIYIVRSGDSLEKIAEQFYGRRDRWSLLYAANNAKLSGGRPLEPGMELEIPAE